MGRLRDSTRVVSALNYPQYRRYWFGNVASISAQQMLFVAQGWLVLELTGSPLYLGYAGLVTAVPAIVLNLFGGVLADRIDQRKVIMATQGCTALLILALATLIALDAVHVWHVLAIAFVSGGLQAFNNPARQSIFPQLLDKKELMNAIALNSMVWQGSRVIAPAVGGIIVATVGMAPAFYLCALGAAALVVAVAGLKIERQERRQQETMLKDLSTGLGFLAHNSLFAFLIGMTFFNSFFGQSSLQLMPVFARDILDIGASGLGLLFSVYGVGTFMGIMVAGAFSNYEHKGLLIIGGGVIFGAGLVVFAVTPVYPVVMLPLFFTGVANQLYVISIQSTLQSRVPDELRGRVMGVYGMTYNMGPLGAILAGAIAEVAGAQLAVAVGGVAILAFALVIAGTNAQVRGLQAAVAARGH